MKTFKFRKFQFNSMGLTKTAAFVAVLFVCFTFSNCGKENDIGEALSIQNSGVSLDSLAQMYPDNFFLNKEQGVEGRYIVMLKDSYLRPAVLDESPDEVRPTGLEDRNTSRRKEVEAGVEVFIGEKGIDRTKIVYTLGHVIAGFVATLTGDQVAALLSDTRVAAIQQDMLVTVDGKIETGNGIEKIPTSEFKPCGIDLHCGPDNPSNIDKWIWILDSGIDTDHPDLNVQTASPYAADMTAIWGVSPSFEDCQGHGTHVAGIAAAKDNTIGVVGMSAGATVVPVKIFNTCTDSYWNSTLLAALNHVASYDEAGDVVNISGRGYFGPLCSGLSSLKTAIQNLGNSGTWVVLAAGNESNYAGLYEPSCIDGTKVLTVANIDCDGDWSSSSNFNLTSGGPVDFVGVGKNVYSTYFGNTYEYMSGTSMSATHVAGIVHARQSSPLIKGTMTHNGVEYKIPRN